MYAAPTGSIAINTSNVSAPAVLGEFGDADLAGNGGVCVLNPQTVGPILVDLSGARRLAHLRGLQCRDSHAADQAGADRPANPIPISPI